MSKITEIKRSDKPENEFSFAVEEGWEPVILAFACHYCAFAAADLAGVMRLSYPANVKIIRLPCTGKLDHSYILHAFERGVDGVFVTG